VQLSDSHMANVSTSFDSELTGANGADVGLHCIGSYIIWLL